MSDDRPRSLPSQEVTVRLPTEAIRRAKSGNDRGQDTGPLGNTGELRQHLAKACVEALGESLEGSEDVIITPDGDLEANDTKDRDEQGRWQ